MSLKSKIIRILLGVVVLWAAFDSAMLRSMVSRSFAALERDYALSSGIPDVAPVLVGFVRCRHALQPVVPNSTEVLT